MKKNNNIVNGATTIIGVGTVVEGVLKTNASTRIDGTVNGDISSEGVIIVASEGVVNGNINAVEVKIGGVVKGNVTTSGKTELLADGKLIGDIRTESLSIDETAVFQGTCKMNGAKGEAADACETVSVNGAVIDVENATENKD